MELKNQIKRHRQYLRTSLATFGLGLSILGTTVFWPQPEKPEIYGEFSSSQQQIVYLEKTRQKLEDVLNDEEKGISLNLENAIHTRQERIAEIEKIPEFQEYQENYKKLNAKKDVAWYVGAGLSFLGYLGFLISITRAGKIRREYEEKREVKFE